MLIFADPKILQTFIFLYFEIKYFFQVKKEKNLTSLQNVAGSKFLCSKFCNFFLSRISSILFCIAITNNFMYQFYKSKPNISSELTLNRFSAKIGKSNNFWDFPKPSCVFTKKFSRNVERACVLLSYTGFMKTPCWRARWTIRRPPIA